MVAGRNAARVCDAGLAVAAETRLGRSGAADRRTGLRLGARLVAGRKTDPLYVLPQRRAGAVGPGSCRRVRPRTRRQRSRQSGRAVVAGRLADRLRLDRLRGTVPRVRAAGFGREGRRQGDSNHGRRGQQAPALLLLEVRPVPLAHLVARRQGAHPDFQPRRRLGLGRPLADGGAGGRSDAAGAQGGDELEGAAGLGPRRPARGLQLVPRAPAQPALADDGRGGQTPSS